MSEGLQARVKRVRIHGSSKNLQTRLTLLQYLRDCVVPCSCTPALRRKSQNRMAAVLRSAFSCLVKTRNPVHEWINLKASCSLVCSFSVQQRKL